MAITVTPGQVISWDDLNAMLAQHGSPSGAKSIQQLPPRKLTEPERAAMLAQDLDPDDPKNQPTVIRYWTQDGSHFDAVLESPGEQTGDAMAGSGQGSTFRIVEYVPSETFKQTQRQQQNTESRQPPKEKDENGRRYVWNPDQNGGEWVDVGPAPQTKTEEPKPPQERVNPADPARRQVWNPQAGNGQGAWQDAGAVVKPPEESKPPQERVNPADPTRRQVWDPRAGGGAGAWQDAGAVTQKPEEVKPPQERANPADPTRRQVWNPRANNNQGAWEDAGVNAQPQRNLQTVVQDGRLMEVVPGVNGGPPTLREIREQGAPTGPTTRAPSLPEIVVGRSQDALREAYDRIQDAVNTNPPGGPYTAAWGEARRREIYGAAQLTVQEAQLHEQSRQFNQTQAFNVGNVRLQHMSGALGEALKFALSINGKLKPGSAAGANLFRAYFNLQMQFLRDSGINSVVPGGGRSSVGDPATRPPGAGAAQPQRRPPIDVGNPEKVAAAADDAERNLAASATRPWTDAETGPSVVRPSAAAATAPAAPAPTATAAAASPPIPRDPVLTSPAQAPGTGAPLTVRDPWGNTFEMTQQQIDNRPGGSKDLTVVTPAAPAPQAMTAPVPQFAALEPFRMPATPPDAPPPQVDPVSTGMPDPIALARIRDTPPWQLPPDQLPDLVRRFGEDTVFSFPGMGVPA